MAAQPELTTSRLLLRPFGAADAPRVRELAGAREVADTTLNIPHPYPDGAAEDWIAAQPQLWEARERVTWAITEPALGLVGAVGLHLVLAHQRAELGYWIGVPHWGRGYATEAARAVLEFGFGTLGLNRIHANHLARNPASGRVMIKLGMKPEGTRREHVVKWGRFEDLVGYGKLRGDEGS